MVRDLNWGVEYLTRPYSHNRQHRLAETGGLSKKSHERVGSAPILQCGEVPMAGGTSTTVGPRSAQLRCDRKVEGRRRAFQLSPRITKNRISANGKSSPVCVPKSSLFFLADSGSLRAGGLTAKHNFSGNNCRYRPAFEFPIVERRVAGF